MAKAKATTTDTPMRRCAGSTKFGIEPHEAATIDFPVQPSGKDGLGRMCKPHWTEYTGGLRRAAAERTGVAPTPASAATPKAARAPKAPKPATNGAEVKAARAVMTATESLSGRAYLDAVASDEVQHALQVLAGHSSGPEVHEDVRVRAEIAREADAETPLGQDIDSGTEDASTAGED